MKQTLLFLAFFILLTPGAEGQTVYSSPAIQPHSYWSYKPNREFVLGGALTLAGTFIAVGGYGWYNAYHGVDGTTAEANIVEGMLITGGIIALTGGIISTIGRRAAKAHKNAPRPSHAAIYHGPTKECKVRKTGKIVLLSGVAITVAGLIPAFTHGNASTFPSGVGGDPVITAPFAVAGAAVVLSGVGLMVAGAIHDKHLRKITLIATRRNELGIAYNF